MTVNPSGWRPSAPANTQGDATTITGNRALMLEEPLLFEIGRTDQTGVDFGALAKADDDRFAGLARSAPIGLPGLTEPEAVRHYTRLSRQKWHDCSAKDVKRLSCTASATQWKTCSSAWLTESSATRS